MIESIAVFTVLLVTLRIVAALRERNGFYRYWKSGDVNALVHTPLWKLLKGATDGILLVVAVCCLVLFADTLRPWFQG